MAFPKTRRAAAAAAAVAVAAFAAAAAVPAAAAGDTPAAGTAAPLSAVRFGAPEDLGRPIRTTTTLSSQVTQEDGRPVLVAIVGSGGVPVLNVVDVRDNRLLRSFPLPGASSSWGGTVVPDGTVYLLASSRMYRYDPRKKQVEDLGVPVPGEGAFWQLDHDPEGNVYGGSYPRGKVFRFDPKTGRFSVLGDVGQQYARSTAYHNGEVYVGTGPLPAGRLVAFDAQTGAKREVPLPKMDAGTPSWVYSLDVRGDHLFALLSDFPDKSSTLRVYDLRARRWWDEAFPGYNDLRVGPERDGKVYFRWKGYWHTLDLATRKARQLPRPAAGPSHRGGGWVDMGGRRGTVLAGMAFSGAILLTDPRTGAQETRPVVVEGDANDLQAMYAGTKGRLYLSAFLSDRAGVFDTATGKTTYVPMGQAEGITGHGSTVWFGVYPKAHLFELDADAPLKDRENPREVYHIPDNQDRPFGMAASADWVVAGTISDYGRLGGALSVLDRKAGVWKSYRNVVPDQSVVSVAVAGDIAYGATSVFGGLGSTPTATEAKVFAWDLRAGRKIAETALRFGDNPPPRFIGGVTVGPDGLLWGVADGAVFALDPATLAVAKQRVLYPEVRDFGRYRPQFASFGPGGLFYASLAGQLVALDPQTLEERPLNLKVELACVGPDGHLYYRPAGDPARLMRVRITLP